MTLFTQVCSENSLKNAWNIVKKNSSCSGIDKITPQKFEENLNDNIKNISFELKEGLYKSSPVLKLKHDSDEKTRPLVIPTVKDRVVMRSVSDVISPVFEKTFVACNYAYRPKKSALEATEDIDFYIQKDYRFFFRTDIKSFFESINHEILLNKLKESIDEEKILKLIKNFLKTRAFGENDLVEPISGLHQGSPISPFMSNIYLNNFDKNMVNHGFQIIRYCDDAIEIK